jgi:hypothetical protein
VLHKERQNLPAAVKQLVVLLTPGGILALALASLCLSALQQPSEKCFVVIVIVSVATLIVGYCMLVFDDRYVLPLIPLLIAIAVPFVLPCVRVSGLRNEFPRTRMTAFTLLVAGTLFCQVYWASPFRSIRRDYEMSSYDAAQKLRTIPGCNKLAVIGRGPYQEHGVGWEAGIYASYFASCRMVAFLPDVPSPKHAENARKDLLSIGPDAILLFGKKSDVAYESFSTAIQDLQIHYFVQEIVDPEAGEVGKLLWRRAELR